MRTISVAVLLMLSAPALAQPTTESVLASYQASISGSYTRETLSQCLARARTTLLEIVVCGERERADRYRLGRSGTMIITDEKVQSPAERVLGTVAMIRAAQSTVGTGYLSSLPTEPGYLRRSYKLVSNMFLGRDPDLE